MTSARLAAITAMVSAFAFADTLYPVSTVTTDGDGIATNLLEECIVQIVDSEGGITGSPAFTCAQSNWRLKSSADGKTLSAVYYPTGAKIILR